MPGGTFFFTVVAADRTARTLTEHIGALREAWRYVRSRHPFRTDAVVILPDHLHAVWTLPSGDADFSLRWRLIKERFSRAVPHGEPISASRRRAGERGIWQRRFLEHLVRNEADLAAHVDYIHYNPVRHGLVARAIDWPWSSIHREIRAGRMPADWAAPDASRTVRWSAVGG